MKYESLKDAESKPQAHGATNTRQQVAQAWLKEVNQDNLSKKFKPSQNQKWPHTAHRAVVRSVSSYQ